MGVTIREKPPGSGAWWIFISHHGKRRSKKVGSRARALKVAEDTRHLLAQGDLGILKQPPGAVQTFYEYAREWLDRYIAPPMRQPGTFRRYSTLLEQHIKPVIGHIPITDLTRSHCRDMLADYYKSGASKSSVELMLCVLTGALGHAVDDELIKANPAAGISRKLRLKRDKDEISPLTTAQVNKVLDQIATAAPDLWPAFLTAFRTGLRVGELCALRWEDINFAERNISVQRTAQDQRVKDKTKTDAGRRRVDLSDQLLQVLRQHHRKWTEKHLASGGKLPPWVFQTETGKLLAQNTLRRVFDRALAKISLEHRRIHDIRHSYASLLLSAGTPILYVKEQLGHRSIQMTVDIYGHFIPSSSRAAVNALDDQAGKEYTCRTK